MRFLFSDQNSESDWSWMSYKFEIDYADGRVDEFEVKADTNDTFSQFNSMEGSIGQTIAFLSQGGAVNFDTNSNDATIGITNNTTTGKTDYSLLGAGDSGADLLLFSLEYIDATNYA